MKKTETEDITKKNSTETMIHTMTEIVNNSMLCDIWLLGDTFESSAAQTRAS